MNPLVQPDPGLFIWTIVTFLVLLALLTKFAWTPLLTALQQRQQRITESLAAATRASEESDRQRREADEVIRKAHVEANAILASSRSGAERVREESKQQARTDAAAILAAAERQVALEKTRARQDVRREAVDLSILIASKLLQRNLTADDNRKLIDDVIGSFDRPRPF